MAAPDAKDGSAMKTGEQGGRSAAGGGSGGDARAPGARSLTLSRRFADRRRRTLGRRAAEEQAAARRVAEEQRRLAAEIHDLVLQDLSFALATMRSIAFDPSSAAERSAGAISAAERALAAARTIVVELGRNDERPVAERVEQGAREAARGVPLEFSMVVEPGTAIDPTVGDALVHIAREAVTNAVKHGSAGRISVSLTHSGRWHLIVCDDGVGFDERSAIPGFGLASMRVLSETLGGSFAIDSRPGGGTEIRAALP